MILSLELVNSANINLLSYKALLSKKLKKLIPKKFLKTNHPSNNLVVVESVHKNIFSSNQTIEFNYKN